MCVSTLRVSDKGPMDRHELPAPDTGSRNILVGVDLMELLYPSTTGLRSENMNGGPAEEEDVGEENVRSAKRKRNILPTSERWSTSLEEIPSSYGRFKCPPKCPSGGKCLTSGMVTIDSTSQCRLMNKQRGCLRDIKAHLVARLMGFRVVNTDQV